MVESSAVYVTLGRSAAGPAAGITVTVEREAPATPFHPDGDLRTWLSGDITSIGIEFPSLMVDTASAETVDDVTDALLDALGAGPGPALLLSVRHPDLVGLAWERMAAPLARQVVRFGQSLAAHAYEPVDLPVSVLLVDVDERDGRLEPVLGYFRGLVAVRRSRDQVERLISSTPADIVHLGVRVRDIRSGGPEAEVGYLDGSVLDPESLARAVRSAGTRLVVLEAAPSGFATLTDAQRRVANALHEATGVAVIASGPASFRAFYHDLTHDLYLTDLVRTIEPSIPGEVPALWVRHGGDGALRLNGAAARLGADVIDEHLRVAAADRAWRAASRLPDGFPSAPDTDRVLSDLAQLRARTYSFDQETLGVVPMEEARAELEELRGARASLVPELARVLNAWVRSAGEALPPHSSFAPGTRYELAVSIGRPDRHSVVESPSAFDVSALSDAYDDDGDVVLTVVISSNDIVVDHAEEPRLLRLPRPPGGSEMLLIGFATSPVPGIARLRIGIHHGTNLIQSLLMTLDVTGTASAGGTGYKAQLEWSLSSTFEGLDEMDKPAITIVTNEDPRGSHTFVVYGASDPATPSIHRQLDIEPGQLTSAVGGARRSLQEVCATLRDGELDRYRYRDRRVDCDRLLGDLARLARKGAGLFAELTFGSDETFNDHLENRLRGGQLIQVAAVRSANYVFPWNLVYDHEIIEGRANVLCPVARQIIVSGGTGDELDASPCFADQCPDRDDPRVVCPAGFWGFRHRVEQPLLTLPAIEPVDDGSPRHDVVTRIGVGLGFQFKAVIGVSETLSDWLSHSAAAAQTIGSGPRVTSSVEEMLVELRQFDLHLAYFYCHGGRRDADTFLSLGTRRVADELYPVYLRKLRWPDQHPFVFINGCNTVGVGPDDLLTFNRVFAKAQASGLLGTEIAIPEQLAQVVADEFLRRFAAGQPVGWAVRAVRLDLLVRGNPLGLAYTPYCMAALRLSR